MTNDPNFPAELQAKFKEASTSFLSYHDKKGTHAAQSAMWLIEIYEHMADQIRETLIEALSSTAGGEVVKETLQ